MQEIIEKQGKQIEELKNTVNALIETDNKQAKWIECLQKQIFILARSDLKTEDNTAMVQSMVQATQPPEPLP